MVKGQGSRVKGSLRVKGVGFGDCNFRFGVEGLGFGV